MKLEINFQILDLDFHTSDTHSYNQDITIRELENAIQQTKPAAAGPDNFHILLLKHAPDINQLLDIFNTIWKIGSFPESWKIATVIPILKPSKYPLLPESYRPISLTSVLCKVLERRLISRLKWKLENDSSLCNQQCGFRAGRSTQDQLLYLQNNIHNSFSTGRHLLAIFFDFTKAFDMAWRYKILKKLHDLNLRGCLPIFIRNFLSQ